MESIKFNNQEIRLIQQGKRTTVNTEDFFRVLQIDPYSELDTITPTLDIDEALTISNRHNPEFHDWLQEELVTIADLS